MINSQECDLAPQLESTARQDLHHDQSGRESQPGQPQWRGQIDTFALLNGTLHEDGGDYSIPKQWQMGQVSQDMPETEQSATDFVIDSDANCSPPATSAADAEASDDGMRMARSLHGAQ